MRSSVVVSAAGVLIAALTLATGACNTGSEQAAAGGTCFTASDCQPGLVCIPQKDGARVCSNDLTSVTGKPPPEGDAAAGDAAVFDGNAPSDSAPPVDTGAPDTGAPDTGIADANDAG
ncbi:MAG: hypothetical protein JWP97_6201 [Labilithrix sp.]|nr:hypothetical protein [Labilithrix sp.]